MLVDVLDGDGRLVDEDTDGQSQPAKRHDIDRLTGQLQKKDGPQHRHGDRDDDDETAPPVPQEQQHHQTGQYRSEDTLRHETLGGIDHEDGLVELIADIDVRRQEALHLRYPFPQVLHHLECGSIGRFYDRRINRSLAIDQRIIDRDIRTVGDARHVVYIDGRIAVAGDRDVLEMLDLFFQRIDRGDI